MHFTPSRIRFRYLLVLLAALLAEPIGSSAQNPALYRYSRVGSTADVTAKPQSGFALMGGGTDLDEAFRWMCKRARGGDFLVLRAAGTDAYNPYIAGLENGQDCKLNSVATLIIASREAASQPFVAKTIAQAEAIFIAGGNQANYVRFWTGTPVQMAINAAIGRGIPIGGTSAGLAVMGEWAYSAEGDKPDDPNLSGKEALLDPFGKRVTLIHGFLEIPLLRNTIFDSHFAKRDRMGRLLTFLFRLSAPDGKPLPPGRAVFRGVGVDEGAAILLEADGRGQVIGNSAAYFLEWDRNGIASRSVADSRGPLDLTKIEIQKVAPGHIFDFKGWRGEALEYSLTVKRGEIHSNRVNEAIY